MAIINGNDRANMLAGTAGPDRIDGRGGDDVIEGLGGADILFGGGGRDAVEGGEGADSIRGGSSRDLLDGGDDDDLILGDAGDDNLSGRTGDDELRGGNNNDFLEGDVGDDILVGDRGEDLLFRGSGDDLIALGADIADTAVFSYGLNRYVPGFQTTDTDVVGGLGSGPAHRLEFQLFDDDNTPLNARDFLDSDDEGRITAADAEVRRAGDDLVLDLDAVLARAFGPGDYGTQQVTLKGAGGGFDAGQVSDFGDLPEPDGAASASASTTSLTAEPAGTTDTIF